MTGSHPASAVGLVRTAARRVASIESFFLEFLTGAEDALAEHGVSVLLSVVPDEAAERETYTRWASAGIVDAVLLMDVRVPDPRPALVTALGLPAVVVGSWTGEPALPAVSSDDTAATRAVAEHVLGLGHRAVGHVTGPPDYNHTQTRRAVLDALCAEAGVVPVTLAGDYSEEAGERLTRELLAAPQPPTVVVYDNDVMAVAGLRAARSLGLDVPGDLSLVGWDDSALCRLTTPALTTTSLDVHALGVQAGTTLLDVLAGVPPRAHAPLAAGLTVRGTTGPPPSCPALHTKESQ